VPVRAGVGDVAVLLGHHEERQRFVPLVGVAQCRSRRDRDAVGAGRAPPERGAVLLHDRHRGASHRRARVEPGHEHEGVLRAVLHGDAEVRDLHDRGARRIAVVTDGAAGAVEDAAIAHGRPHEAGAVRVEAGERQAV
jgi:hypothetical protein